jgi:tetratricopeptide (TPR) repeat protein
MTYLKLQDYSRAEMDCTSALRIEPTHVKSLLRRATARNALGKHRSAILDLKTATAIDPSKSASHSLSILTFLSFCQQTSAARIEEISRLIEGCCQQSTDDFYSDTLG